MLSRGDLIPHFHVMALDGSPCSYPAIWQRKNLVLIVLPECGAEDYVAGLQPFLGELDADDSRCIVTRDAIAGVPRPGAVVADRWGEISFITEGLPPPGDLAEWLRYTRVQCPECQGETR